MNANQKFRPIADFLRTIRYLHLVPHLLREPGRQLDRSDDPYGSDFLLRIARTPARTRDQRLRRIGNGLKAAVPQLSQLELVQDDAGRPHLEARYGHWRPKGAKQNEHDFSDGTLRLVGLLWSLLEGKRDTGPVMLEEPELSLHSSVVRQLPSILSRFRGTGGPQVLLTTHSEEILKDQGLGFRPAFSAVKFVNLAVEGDTDVPVAERLIGLVGLAPHAVVTGPGAPNLDPRIPESNRSGEHLNWLILRDLDHDASCPAEFLPRTST